MKKRMSVALASVILSTSMTVPAIVPVMAESTLQSNASINTPQDFIDTYLSKSVLNEDNVTTTLQAYTSLDEINETNYQKILGSESTYTSFSEDMKTGIANQMESLNMPSYDAFLARAKEVEQSLQPVVPQAPEPEVIQEQQPTVQEVQPVQEEQPVVQETQPEVVQETQPEVVQETQPEVVQETQPVVQETQPEVVQETQPEVVQEQQPARDYTYTYTTNGVTVIVQASAGTFDDNVEMVANTVAVDNAKYSVDIFFRVQGTTTEVEPRQAVTVTLQYADLDSDNYEVVHILDDASTQTVAQAGIQSSVFETTSFSVFAIMPKNEEAPASSTETEPTPTQEQQTTTTTETEVVEEKKEEASATQEAKAETETQSQAQTTNPLTDEDSVKAQAFVTTYLTGYDGLVYKSATAQNYVQILSGMDSWNALTTAQKSKVNAILSQASGKTYLGYLKEAQTFKRRAVQTSVETTSSPYAWTSLAMMGCIAWFTRKLRKLRESK